MLLPGMAAVTPEVLAQSGKLVDQEMASPGSVQTESARRVMVQAREAYDKGDYAKAKTLCEKAKTMPPNFQMGDDFPDLMLSDIARKAANTAATDTKMAAKPDAKATAPKKVLDPKMLLKNGREALAVGKLDQAQDLAREAEAIRPSKTWGLFDDTPMALLKDVSKAKAKKDQTDSMRMMAEAHTLYEKKNVRDTERAANLEKAGNLCLNAEKLHGPYSMWDFSEKPSSLLTEIESAKAKLKTSSAMASKAVNPPAKNEAKIATADKVMPTGSSSATPFKPTSTTALKDKTVSPYASATPINPEQTLKTSDDLARLDAEQHLKQARFHQKEGRLIEARMECMAAQNGAATWKAGEETPKQMLETLRAAAQVKLIKLCNDADEDMVKKDANEVAKADMRLTEAQELATAYSLDAGIIIEKKTSLKAVVAASGMQPIAPRMGSSLVLPGMEANNPPVAATAPMVAETPLETKTVAINPVVTEMAAPATAVETTPAVTKLVEPVPTTVKMEVPTDTGAELLTKARLELQKGETETARKMAIEVLSGPYTAKADAEFLLRTIESEELQQRKLTSQRTFDSGITAYNNRDYAKALAYFKQVEPTLMEPARRSQLSELIVTAQMRAPSTSGQVANAVASKTPKSEVYQAGGFNDQNKPNDADSLLKQQEQLQSLEFQKLRGEALKLEQDATVRFGKGETSEAMKDLNDFIGKVKQSHLDADQQKVVVRQLEIRVDRLKLVQHNVEVERDQKKSVNDLKADMSRQALAKQLKEEQLSKLMKEFYKFYDAGKMQEANNLALKMHDIDPNDPTVDAIQRIAKMKGRVVANKQLNSDSEQYNYEAIKGIAEQGPYVGGPNPLSLPPGGLLANRLLTGKDGGIVTMRSMSMIEKEIEGKLTKTINVNFKDNSLEQVVEYFRTYSGLNIVIDTKAMAEENIDPKTLPVTEVLNNISMRSALNVILHKARLAYKVRNDVLWITTEKHGHGDVMQKAFPVADLVVKVANADPNLANGLKQALDRANNLHKPQVNSNGPRTPMSGLGSGEAVSKTVSMEQVNLSGGGKLVNNKAADTWNATGASETAERELISLITHTIRPETWEELGGQGRLEFHGPTMALVVNQTPDIIEEIASLLKSLRRLQDREVAIEVKMITLSESFYEKIGIDFSMDIKTNTSKVESQIVTGVNNTNPGATNTLRSSGQVIGLQAPGVYTPNLDVPVRTNTNQLAIPPFGGYLGQGSGGLALGLAFLNDIQVSLFLEAAQGDRRINVMQAPKLTMFNGQSATIIIEDQQFFMTGITVSTANGQLTFTPNNSPFRIGVQMTIQPTISGDGTFVRMNINHQVNNLASTNVPLFPITTFITPVFEGGSQGQPIPFTQYVQQPTITSLTIQTTVAVPDGGTVLLGGMKTMSEGRNEFGPPVLSKIPYLNRLFRNNAYGRDSQSLLLMVTPRIIINQEEQLRQTGTSNDDENVDNR